ncbi:MAG: hypothetical protein LBJ31_03805 [Treponema sp.]|jgi:hypothetical protein|nr:hypothetical protein [Treponema sp.]
MEVKPAEFARLSGVSRQTISGKIKNKTLILNSGGMLDTENPVNAAYMSRHGPGGNMGGGFGFSAAPPPAKKNGASSGIGPPLQTGAAPGRAGTDSIIAQAAGVPVALLNLTLRELVTRYGGNLLSLEKHAKILRDLTMASEKEQRIQERRLALIEKDFVVSRLFQFIDVLMKQLIEYPESAASSLAATVLAHGEAGLPAARAEISGKIKSGIESIISSAKQQIITELNGLKSKYQNGEDRVEALVSAMEDAVNE